MKLSRLLAAASLAVPLAACNTTGGYYETLPAASPTDQRMPRTRYIPAPVYQPVYQDDGYYEDDGASPLPSESQLQGAGCGIVDRNFQRGTLTYQCPVGTRFYVGNPGAGAGVRCAPMGRSFNGAVYAERYLCRENMPDFDADYGQRSYGYPRNDWNAYPRNDGGWGWQGRQNAYPTPAPRTRRWDGNDHPPLRPHAGPATPPPVLVQPPVTGPTGQPPRGGERPPHVTPSQPPMAPHALDPKWRREHGQQPMDPRRFPPADAPKSARP